jgi:hypothetical protein
MRETGSRSPGQEVLNSFPFMQPESSLLCSQKQETIPKHMNSDHIIIQ